jgi:hypothetical protein
MFLSLYSVYCLCVNVSCTAATGCQPNCSYIYIYIYISYIINDSSKTNEYDGLSLFYKVAAHQLQVQYDDH